MDVSNDYTEVTFLGDGEMDIAFFGTPVIAVPELMIAYQIFSGIDSEEVSVHATIIDRKNGNIVAEANRPWEPLEYPEGS